VIGAPVGAGVGGTAGADDVSCRAAGVGELVAIGTGWAGGVPVAGPLAGWAGVGCCQLACGGGRVGVWAGAIIGAGVIAGMKTFGWPGCPGLIGAGSGGSCATATLTSRATNTPITTHAVSRFVRRTVESPASV
jgi:hypothetical protein